MYPNLITLEGEIDDRDLALLYSGDFTESKYNYFVNKYPEYFGFWAALARGAKKVGKGIFKGIGKRVRRKRAARKKKKKKAAEKKRLEQTLQQERIQQARAIAFQQQEKRKKQTNTLLTLTPLLFLPLLLGDYI